LEINDIKFKLSGILNVEALEVKKSPKTEDFFSSLGYKSINSPAFILNSQINFKPKINNNVKAVTSDPLWALTKRPLIKGFAVDNEDELFEDARFVGTYVPITLLGTSKDNDDTLFKLKDIVVERIIDSDGTKYVKLYHGTISKFQNIFADGAINIAYDKAKAIALGQGFYLTASFNEAKRYACDAEPKNNNSQAIILVVGIAENDIIQGVWHRKDISDDIGDPLKNDSYFARNPILANQFAFFSNIKPYLKLFEIIVLPHEFYYSPKDSEDYGFSVDDDEEGEQCNN
jgi:hypothetical protein